MIYRLLYKRREVQHLVLKSCLTHLRRTDSGGGRMWWDNKESCPSLKVAPCLGSLVEEQTLVFLIIL